MVAGRDGSTSHTFCCRFSEGDVRRLMQEHSNASTATGFCDQVLRAAAFTKAILGVVEATLARPATSLEHGCNNSGGSAFIELRRIEDLNLGPWSCSRETVYSWKHARL